MKIQLVILAAGIALLSFGFVGAQKPGQSQAEKLFARAKPDDFMGDSGCAGCHEAYAASFAESAHAAVVSNPHLPADKRGCEGCHGPGGIHQADENAENISFRKMTPKESSAACLRCHSKTLASNHWNSTDHARADLSCVSCHQIHPNSDPALGSLNRGNTKPQNLLLVAKRDPKSLLRADENALCGSCHPAVLGEFRNVNHHPVPEGRVVCSDCHSPHPTKGDKAIKDTAKGKCVTCHTEMAGPFVYEHDPVSGHSGDGCQECHKPHGSGNPKMLNSITRGLCAQCHTEKISAHYPGKTCWQAGCHVANHGSNTDPRFLKP